MAVSTSVPTPTATLPSAPTQTLTPASIPAPVLTSLTDAEAITLIEEELAARGVATQTLRITIAGEPRSVSIRYSSTYNLDSRVFKAQTALVNLAVARVVVLVRPPIDGGIRLAVIPAGHSEVGLRVTIIDGASLAAWSEGDISDQEFVGQWTVGDVTRE